ASLLFRHPSPPPRPPPPCPLLPHVPCWFRGTVCCSLCDLMSTDAPCSMWLGQTACMPGSFQGTQSFAIQGSGSLGGQVAVKVKAFLCGGESCLAWCVDKEKEHLSMFCLVLC
ncbi:unnamed protein product, partial [Discosporangium mesarthrocarpum]